MWDDISAGEMIGVDWINHNANPVYGVFNGINSQFTHEDFLNNKPMTHGQGVAEIAMSIIPVGGPIGKGFARLAMTADQIALKELIQIKHYERSKTSGITCR